MLTILARSKPNCRFFRPLAIGASIYEYSFEARNEELLGAHHLLVHRDCRIIEKPGGSPGASDTARHQSNTFL